MKAAVIKQPGTAPTYEDFDEPVRDEGLVSVAVTASSLSQITKSRATGKHYSASGLTRFIPGIDGVGTLPDGSRAYFVLPEMPFGGMAERCIVKPTHCVPLPKDLDDVRAAAIAIPGMSSWAALIERAKYVAGETVLINGATGTSGRLAVQIARYLGAGKVIATGRDPVALEALQTLGADITINLQESPHALENALETQFKNGIDIVLDYLWGPSAEALLIAGAKAAANTKPVRFVQIGSISAATINLPSAVLRSSSIEMLGSGIGSVPLQKMLGAIRHVLDAAVPGGFAIATTAVPLSEVTRYWTAADDRTRIVFTLDDRL